MSKFKLLGFLLSIALVGAPGALRAQEISTTILHDLLSASALNAGLTPDSNGYRAPTGSQAVWFGGGAAAQYTQNTSIKQSAGNRGLLAYFSPSTGLVNLDPGESLTVQFTFKYSGGTGASSVGDLRIALLNSGGNGTQFNALGAGARVVNDNFSLTAGGDTPRGYSGYLIDATAAGTSPLSNSLSFWRRDGAAGRSQQWLGPTSSDLVANSAFSQIGLSGGGTIGPIANNSTVYVGTLSVTRISNTVRDSDNTVTSQAVTKLTFSITSGGSTVMSYTVNETADTPHTGFDSFFIFSIYNAALEITDFVVTKTSVSLGILGQPVSKIVAAGTDTSLSVTAVGAPAPTFQWQKDGVDVPGATSAKLTLTNVQPANAGVYRVIVKNANGSVTSDNATLTVATVPIITLQPTGPTIFEGINTTMSTAAVGAGTLTYQWKKDGVDLVDDDHLTGSTTPTVTFTKARTTDFGVYTVAVTNSFGTTLTEATTFTVYSSTPPSIKTQPASQTTLEGTVVTFTVAAEGPPPFTYQWRKDGVNLTDDGTRTSGATGATLTLTGVRLVEAGKYSVVVSNPAASATSADATLVVNPAPTPLPPVATGARNVIETSFNARWLLTNYATGYRLDVSKDPAFATYLAGYQDLDVGPSLTHAVEGLSINTNYYYRVRAYNSSGVSANSNTITVTAQSPVAPAFTSPATTTFTAGVAGAFTFTGSGSPLPTFTATGLPTWATLDSSSGLLSGTPPDTAIGTTVTLTVTGQNDTAPDARQTFALVIVGTPTVAEPVTISTLAGLAGTAGTTDATGSAARFNTPTGVALDSAGNIYLADAGSHLIRKVTSTGSVSTFAGKAGTPGSANGTGTAATFDTPTGLAIDSAGNLYVADTLNHAIRKITSAGVVTTLAGKAGTSGSADGSATDARFYAPQGLALSGSGADLYVADTNNHTVRKITLATGVVTTFAGTAGQAGSVNGVGADARFNAPSDVAIDKNGTVYVADTDNNTIRAIASNGSVVTLAGLAGSLGAADGSGPAARFNHPSALAVDSSLTLYVLDTDNHTLRKVVSALGTTTTIAGFAGTSGSADGADALTSSTKVSAARFKFPSGIAVSSTGDLYIADTNNHTLRLGQLPNLPVISTQPQSLSVTTGGSATFTVKASGRPAVSYQWYLNGGPVTGGTTDTLTISNATSVNAGDYTVIVSNVVGSVTSNRAGLVVNLPATTPVGISKVGGGGAPSDFFYGALALLVGLRALTRRGARSRPLN